MNKYHHEIHRKIRFLRHVEETGHVAIFVLVKAAFIDGVLPIEIMA